MSVSAGNPDGATAAGSFFLHQQRCYTGGTELGLTYPAYASSKPSPLHYLAINNSLNSRCGGTKLRDKQRRISGRGGVGVQTTWWRLAF